MLEKFENIYQQALDDLKKVIDLDTLEQFRMKYLARKGQLTQMLTNLGKLPREQRPKAGHSLRIK
jgi:phenylalanyl-tRNA synthetase alpha chain